jgi:hypothetical protein
MCSQKKKENCWINENDELALEKGCFGSESLLGEGSAKCVVIS